MKFTGHEFQFGDVHRSFWRPEVRGRFLLVRPDSVLSSSVRVSRHLLPVLFFPL